MGSVSRKFFLFASLSLRVRFAFSSLSLRFRFAFASLSLRVRFASASLPLRFRFALASLGLRSRIAFASLSLHFRFALASISNLSLGSVLLTSCCANLCPPKLIDASPRKKPRSPRAAPLTHISPCFHQQATAYNSSQHDNNSFKRKRFPFPR